MLYMVRKVISKAFQRCIVSIFTPWAKNVMYKYKEVGILGITRGKCRGILL